MDNNKKIIEALAKTSNASIANEACLPLKMRITDLSISKDNSQHQNTSQTLSPSNNGNHNNSATSSYPQDNKKDSKE